MANDIALGIGVLLIGLGLVGFLLPDPMGAHLGTLANVLHVATGVATVQLARHGSPRGLGRLCLGLALFYLALGGVGLATGQGTDEIIAPLGELLVLGHADHVVHAVVGAAFLLVGLLPAAADGRRERWAPVER